MREGAALLLLLSSAPLWAAKPIPPAPRSYVLNEGVISAGAEARLSRTLSEFEQATGRQFAVALFQSLDSESLEDYSNRVFRAWKIGGAKANDGLLFCLYRRDRKWRVEVGYGLEGSLTDLSAGAIARERGSPRFRAGDFDGGVLAVADALAARIRGDRIPAPAGEDAGRLSGAALILFFFAVVFLMRLRFSPYGIGAGGSWGSGGGSWGGGGFSGGGGSSGGGGASGSW